jgi:hypothetical protein
MRNGQNNKRMRGRNRGKGGGHHHHQNPLSRMYESNGPDVKIRGNASHIAEKYLQLARDAQSSGDPIAAENYYQHAEHYFRLIAAAQEHLRQTQPNFYQQPQQGGGGNYGDDSFDDGDGDQPPIGGEPYAPQPQQFYPREQQQPQYQPPQQHHQQPPQQQHHQQPQQPPQNFQPRQQNFQPNDEDVDRLPSFITGGQPQPAPQQMQGANGPNNQNGQNGYDGGSPDRFPLHRRRRRHRGPRDHASGEGDASTSPGGPQMEE